MVPWTAGALMLYSVIRYFSKSDIEGTIDLKIIDCTLNQQHSPIFCITFDKRLHVNLCLTSWGLLSTADTQTAAAEGNDAIEA